MSTQGTWQTTSTSGGGGFFIVAAIVVLGGISWVWGWVEESRAAKAVAEAQAAEAAARAAALNPDPGVTPYLIGALAVIAVLAFVVCAAAFVRSLSPQRRAPYISATSDTRRRVVAEPVRAVLEPRRPVIQGPVRILEEGDPAPAVPRRAREVG